MLPKKNDLTDVYLVTHFAEPIGYARELEIAQTAGQVYAARRYPTYPLHWRPSSNGKIKLFFTRPARNGPELVYWTGCEIKVLRQL